MTRTSRIDAPARRPLTEQMDRQPPFDIQAEIGALGSVLLMPSVIDDVALIVRSAEDFYDDAHQKIWRAAIGLHLAGKSIDHVTLTNRLKSAGDFEAIGGAAYFSKILHAVPNAAHAIYYAEIVRDKAAYRAGIYVCTEALRDLYDEAEPAAQITSKLVDNLLAGSRQITSALPRLIGEVCRDVVQELHDRAGVSQPPTISSGLETGDRAGFLVSAGELAILAARPGGGKTAFLAQTAVHNARQGRTVLFASLEMKALAVAKRQLYAAAGINGHSVRMAGADLGIVEDLERACRKFEDLPLLLWDPGRIDVGAIRAMAASVKKNRGLDLLIVDYTSWILAADPRANRRDQIGEIVKGLRDIGQRLDVPVLLAHQLNRDADKEEPRLSHLRESGCVEEDADLVAFLDPVDGSEPALVNFIVAKNRHGARGKTVLRWYHVTMQFADPEEF